LSRIPQISTICAASAASRALRRDWSLEISRVNLAEGNPPAVAFILPSDQLIICDGRIERARSGRDILTSHGSRLQSNEVRCHYN
jgi:hypothetical protein